MRKYSIFFLSLLFLTSISFTSCKKDDAKDDETLYMEGTLVYTLPGYLTAFQEVELKATGITTPTAGATYKWYTTGFGVDSIVGESVKIIAPGGYGDYTVILTVSHPDYASKTLSKTTVVINPNVEGSYSGTIKGPGILTDTRDGKIYNFKQFDKLYWFTSNLQWEGAGKAYNNEKALAPIYGVLYTWNEATAGESKTGLGNGPKGVCPQGWSVPTKEDWENLGAALKGSPVIFDSSWAGLGEKASANAKLNGTSIWKYSPNNLKNNTLGWNALPGGSSSNYFKSFANISQFGFWWSSSQKDSNNGEYRFIHFDTSDFPYNFAEKGYMGASVRCVKLVQ